MTHLCSMDDKDGDSDLGNASPIALPREARIKELLAIDADIANLVKTAGLAVQSLTSETGSPDTTKSSPETSKQAFEEHTTNYFHLVQSVSARLRQQAFALEEAGILSSSASTSVDLTAPPAPLRATKLTNSQKERQDPTVREGMHRKAETETYAPMKITNGGMGALDVGWLNSRRDAVGRMKEAELWAEARRRLEALVEQGADRNLHNGEGNGQQDDDEMQTDE